MGKYQIPVLLPWSGQALDASRLLQSLTVTGNIDTSTLQKKMAVMAVMAGRSRTERPRHLPRTGGRSTEDRYNE
jgi:hypothetical protein